MNPFIQKALNEVHTYPANSIAPPSRSLNSNSAAKTSPPSADMYWRLKRDPKSGGLVTDPRLRLQLVSSPKDTNGSKEKHGNTDNNKQQDANPTTVAMADVFALGDVAIPSSGPLPATAQVANQEAVWLAKRLNRGDLGRQVFVFRNLGIMTYLGNWKAMVQTGTSREITGWAAWVIWRGAYLTKTRSWRNKLLIPIYWYVFCACGMSGAAFEMAGEG